MGGSDAKRVLIVEDDSCYREAVKCFLAENGFDVAETDTVAGTRKLLKSDRFDVVLLDLDLKDGNGFDLLYDLPEEVRHRIIIMTAHGSISKAVSSIKKGVFEFLEKPLDYEIFLIHIDMCLRHNEPRP